MWPLSALALDTPMNVILVLSASVIVVVPPEDAAPLIAAAAAAVPYPYSSTLSNVPKLLM